MGFCLANTRISLVFVMLCILFFCVPTAWATLSLNVGQAPMSEQTRSARIKATKEALQQVLVKLSGAQDVLSHKSVKSLLNNVQNYVDASRFIAQPYVGLEVEFDQSRLEQWLKEQQLPLWGEQRPSGLLWLIFQDPISDQKSVIHAASEHTLKKELELAIERRAIPISLPIYDLEDIAYVAPIDIWGQFVDTLYMATERYQARATLAARIYPNSEYVWQLDGFVKDGDMLRLVSFTGLDTQSLLDKFVDFYANLSAARFAIDTKQFANNNRVNHIISISGTSDIAILSALQNYLSTISVIDDFAHISQHGDTATFELSLLTTQEFLHETFMQSQLLKPIIQVDDYQESENGASSYQWQP